MLQRLEQRSRERIDLAAYGSCPLENVHISTFLARDDMQLLECVSPAQVNVSVELYVPTLSWVGYALLLTLSTSATRSSYPCDMFAAQYREVPVLAYPLFTLVMVKCAFSKMSVLQASRVRLGAI